ncbi:hypothetical protein JR316_0005527 [Psilocybe cubensis]|nr:hypothetical protein JR316_0005527 [Psilocybe cubensis]KAH9481009.1 hypothetical protein JR316_0005527 [Psilocybe cubensis]
MVSRKTVQNHAKLFKNNSGPGLSSHLQIPRYQEWLQSRSARPERSEKEEEMILDNLDNKNDSEWENDLEERPLKRHREQAVPVLNETHPNAQVYNFENEQDDDIYVSDNDLNQNNDIELHCPHPPDDEADSNSLQNIQDPSNTAQHDFQALAHLDSLTDSQPKEDLEEDDRISSLGQTYSSHSRIEHVKITQKFIDEICNASLQNGKLANDALHRLQNPEKGPVDISDPDTRLSLDLFIACENASQRTYGNIRQCLIQRFPELDGTLLTYDAVKTLTETLTGVVSISDDMCINSCYAFTGPFSDLQKCYYCSEPRYNPLVLAETGKKVPQKEACTFPLGPQIQALRRSKEGAIAMTYRDKKTREILNIQKAIADANGNIGNFVYEDYLSGSDYLDLFEDQNLTENDTTVIFSFDGAQLYRNKGSDTWIAVWIICEYSPTTRYKKKHVLPAVVIPGPNKPKNSDSFTFRSFHHLSAIQRENNGKGIRVWNGNKNTEVFSRVIHLLTTADAVGLTEMDGRVGHHGAQGCRIGCSMKGRHKPSSGHYFAVHLRPLNAVGEDCSHDDLTSKMQQILYTTHPRNIKINFLKSSIHETRLIMKGTESKPDSLSHQ